MLQWEFVKSSRKSTHRVSVELGAVSARPAAAPGRVDEGHARRPRPLHAAERERPPVLQQVVVELAPQSRPPAAGGRPPHAAASAAPLPAPAGSAPPLESGDGAGLSLK